MEEIQGLYVWGHDQDVGTFSKFSPFPAQPLYVGSSTIYHSWCLHPTASPPTPNLVCHFSYVRTHINSCISLDVFHIGLGEAQVSGWTLSRADNARSDRILQCKGTSHGNNKLPLPDIG